MDRSVSEAVRQTTLLAESLAIRLPASQPRAAERLIRVVGRTSEVIAARAISQAEARARRDTTTGLGNDLAYEPDVAGAVERVSARGGSVALAYLDLNGLGAVNNSEGHAAGNLYLRHFAATVSAAIRASHGRAYRVHGDEFVALFRDRLRIQVEPVLERLRADSACPPFSFGVADCPSEASAPEDLEALADARMYEMKNLRDKPERERLTRAWLAGEHWRAARES
jgi:diguanylate cyclase (GGDEF)-like protein